MKLCKESIMFVKEVKYSKVIFAFNDYEYKFNFSNWILTSYLEILRKQIKFYKGSQKYSLSSLKPKIRSKVKHVSYKRRNIPISSFTNKWLWKSGQISKQLIIQQNLNFYIFFNLLLLMNNMYLVLEIWLLLYYISDRWSVIILHST